ncbi:MAG: hypothetical protein AAB484_03370 [Patescibacteria group bacterium]
MKKISLHIHTPRQVARNVGENSSRDWHLILLCFVILLIIVVAVDVFFYNRLSVMGESEIVQNQPNQILNRIDFDEMVKALNEKKLNLLSVPDRVIADPSI